MEHRGLTSVGQSFASGSWEGVARGIRSPDELYGDSRTAGLLSGSGACDGLSAYLRWDADGHNYTFDGLIFPGDMPA